MPAWVISLIEAAPQFIEFIIGLFEKKTLAGEQLNPEDAKRLDKLHRILAILKE